MTDEDGHEPSDEDVDSETDGRDGRDDVSVSAPPEDASDRDERVDGARSPLSDLTNRLEDRRARAESSGDAELFEEAFKDVSVDSTDADAVWDDLESGGIEEPVAEPESESERSLYVVAKREYCQRCQFFSDPPEVACTYDGADILELTDSEHFTVADCPVVEGIEELRDLR